MARKAEGQKAAQRATLREKLTAQGASFTEQRAAVFEYLSGVEHHPTAEEVFLAIKPALPRISLATVYKNLEALVACGAASKLTYGDGAARYDIRTDHHYHSRCLRCGQVRDLEPLPGGEFGKLVKAPAGFTVKDCRIEIVGYCKPCLAHAREAIKEGT
jgi:Fe2+ or Zn2+ uptake regulation protein